MLSATFISGSAHLGVRDGMVQETDAADNLPDLGDGLAVIMCNNKETCNKIIELLIQREIIPGGPESSESENEQNNHSKKRSTFARKYRSFLRKN